MCFLHFTLRHTHLRNIQKHDNECVDVLSEYLEQRLPKNNNQLYAHSALCMPC